MEDLGNLARYEILVVEDDKDLRRILSFNLKSNGFRVREAENGKVALEMVRERIPDCIVLDVMMPVMDGLETCKRLKSIDRTKNVPIIFLSAKGETEDKIKGMKFDADDYMVKPFDFKELLARIYLHISKNKSKLCEAEREKEKGSKEIIVQISEAISKPLRELRSRFIKLMDGVKGDPELEHVVRECEEQRKKINETLIDFQRQLDPFFEPENEEESVEV